MREKYFAFHFSYGSHVIIYETDGENKTTVLAIVRDDLKEKGYTDLQLEKEMKS
ncbi:hypothetical protein LCGC14_1881750 [marine sediment metagenome]|uniref:Uncharacterized protein n=1 Tax=marine sediment metagenome TaxID=412755 RepID=A0A0F9G218_9ZZZZ